MDLSTPLETSHDPVSPATTMKENSAPPVAEKLAVVSKEVWRDFEKQRGVMSLAFGIIGFGLFIVQATFIIILNDNKTLREIASCSLFLTVVVLSGMVGGSLSMVRRLQAITQRCGDSELSTSLPCLWYAGIASCLLGGIFAVILLYVFLSGTVSGTLFPTFLHAKQLGATVPRDLTLATMAKVVVFSFLAGFAERLVPDALDRLVDASKSKAPGAIK